MELPLLPAGIEGADPLAQPAFGEPVDEPQPQPTLTVVAGGGDTTGVRATLHAVPRP